MRLPRPALLGAALLVALPAFLLTNPAFRPLELRFEGKGPRVAHAFELARPESLYLDYELIAESTGSSRPAVVVRLNGVEAGQLPVEALSRRQFGKARLPAAATRLGANELVVLVDGGGDATVDVRARIHNYFGIAPDIPRAAVVSDEAAALWWTDSSLAAHGVRFAAIAALAWLLEWALSRRGVMLLAPAALSAPVALWSVATDRHVWLYPETLVAMTAVPIALVLAVRALAPKGTLILKLAAVTIATLFLLEAALRLTNAIRPSFIFYSDSYGRYRGQPGAPHHGGVLNSRGFNDVERSVPRPQGVSTRIVALGDSFAFGVVPRSDNYLALTERQLATDSAVEVINMGVSATGPADYRAILVDEGLAYGPDLVLASVYLGNDLESRQPRWYERSYVTTLVNFLWHLGRARGTVVLDGGADAPYDDDAPSLDEGSFLRIQMERAGLYTSEDSTLAASVDRAVSALAGIRDLARGVGADCLVVLIPDETQVDAALQAEVARAWGRDRASIDFTRPTRMVAAALARAGVETLDLLPAFQAAGRETRLYKPRDTHWNRAGNRLAASEIVSALREWRSRRAARTGVR